MPNVSELQGVAEVVLTRHGKTKFSRDNRLHEPIAGGMVDVPLSTVGMQQAIDLITLLPFGKPAAVVASSMSRAVATVQPYAETFGLPVIQDSDLVERRFGRSVEGFRPPNETARLRQQVLEPFWSLPYDLRRREQPFPDMEKDGDLTYRVYRGLNRIAEAYSGQKVVVGGHGDEWATFLSDTGVIPNDIYPLMENGGFAHLVYQAGRTPSSPGRVLETRELSRFRFLPTSRPQRNGRLKRST